MIEFHNIEILDGYFSGVMVFDSYVFNFGYDVEFRHFHLTNCTDPMWSNGKIYTPEQIEDIKIENYEDIQEAIDEYLATHSDLVYAEEN